MRSEDVQEFVLRRPFEPFRLTLTDGTNYDIHHPEMAMIGFSRITLGLPRPSGPDRVFDRVVVESLSHVMQIEPLETASSKDSAS